MYALVRFAEGGAPKPPSRDTTLGREPLTIEGAKPKRWRPRFRLRTLVVLVSLVCCYAACWGPTKRRGERDVHDHIWRIERRSLGFFPSSAVPSACASLPLIVHINRYDWSDMSTNRHYYFWFFGYVAKLPCEREI